MHVIDRRTWLVGWSRSTQSLLIEQVRGECGFLTAPKRGAILYFSDPFERMDGGTRRARAFVESFARIGYELTVVHPSPRGPARDNSRHCSRVLHGMKRRYLPMPLRRRGAIKKASAQLASLGHLDVVISLAPPLLPAARRADTRVLWLDVLDIWSNVALREAAIRRGAAKLATLAQARGLRRREMREYRYADIVTVAGVQDEERIAQLAVARQLAWLPTPVLSVTQRLRPVGSRKVAGFLGNFDYWPNRDAYLQLADKWLGPLQGAGWTTVVAGYGSDKLPQRAGITILGEIADLAEYYDQVTLSLAPVRLGGGMKVKIVEALGRGIPVLSAPEAAEGLPAGILPGIIIAPCGPSPEMLQEIADRNWPDITSALRPFTDSYFRSEVEIIWERTLPYHEEATGYH